MGTLSIEFNEKGVAARGRGVSTSVASHPGMAVLIDLCKLDIRAVVLWCLYYTHLHTTRRLRSALHGSLPAGPFAEVCLSGGHMQLEGRFRGGYATLPSRAFTVPCRCASTLDRNTEGETNLSTDGGTALVHVTPLLEKNIIKYASRQKFTIMMQCRTLSQQRLPMFLLQSNPCKTVAVVVAKSGRSGKNQAWTETLTTRGGVVHMNVSLDWHSQVLLHPLSEVLLKKTTANRK